MPKSSCRRSRCSMHLGLADDDVRPTLGRDLLRRGEARVARQVPVAQVETGHPRVVGAEDPRGLLEAVGDPAVAHQHHERPLAELRRALAVDRRRPEGLARVRHRVARPGLARVAERRIAAGEALPPLQIGQPPCWKGAGARKPSRTPSGRRRSRSARPRTPGARSAAPPESGPAAAPRGSRTGPRTAAGTRARPSSRAARARDCRSARTARRPSGGVRAWPRT